MIFVWLFLELSLFILATLSGVWNFSVLMKNTGLGTSGYSTFSRGNIHASRATAHLVGWAHVPIAPLWPSQPWEASQSHPPEPRFLH